MKLIEDIYLMGSGRIRLSHEIDPNVYLVDGGDELVVIDPGCGLEQELIFENIRSDGLDEKKLKYILVTHAHSDHVSGAGAMRERTGAQVLASEEEALLMETGTDDELGLVRAKRDGAYPPDFVFQHCRADRILNDGEEVAVGRHRLKAIKTPGHRVGNLCYLMKRDGYTALFSSDHVFFKGVISVLNVEGSSLKEYRENMNKLAGLGVDGLFPGHGIFTLWDGQKHIDLAIQRLSAMYPPLNVGYDRDLRPFML